MRQGALTRAHTPAEITRARGRACCQDTKRLETDPAACLGPIAAATCSRTHTRRSRSPAEGAGEGPELGYQPPGGSTSSTRQRGASTVIKQRSKREHRASYVAYTLR